MSGSSDAHGEHHDVAFTEDDHFFHQGYLTHERADEDASELLGLLELDARARVLDAGCGDGRLAVRLAALGHVVVGVDRDPSQLERARAQPRARGVEVTWVQADLARPGALEGLEPFDGAALWFNTWGFASDADNEAVLATVIGAVRPGGLVVIDTLDRDLVRGALGEEEGPVVLERAGERQVDRTVYDERAGRFVTVRSIERHGVSRQRVLRQRLLVAPEWEDLLDRLGVELVSATARGGRPLGDGLELVLVGRRRSRRIAAR